jgi:nucleotide-binding universal stress UspA family protein
MPELRRFLVPTDFTETSDRALGWAIDLASRVGASVTVMHAYEIPILGFPDGALIASPEIATKISDAARNGLDSAVARFKDRGVPLTSVLRDGIAYEEINAVAASIQADLIIIGTHARRGIARALLGSVAENVIRTATIPVVTIHGPREG